MLRITRFGDVLRTDVAMVLILRRLTCGEPKEAVVTKDRVGELSPESLAGLMDTVGRTDFLADSTDRTTKGATDVSFSYIERNSVTGIEPAVVFFRYVWKTFNTRGLRLGGSRLKLSRPSLGTGIEGLLSGLSRVRTVKQAAGAGRLLAASI